MAKQQKTFTNVTHATYAPTVENDGKVVEILRKLGPNEVDPEIGNMFEVRALDSTETFHAYEDELS